MARKAKKTAKRKVLSQKPRRSQSRPVWALLFFTLALMGFVAIWDFELAQSRQHTTEPGANLVGVLGAEGSFWAFYLIGVAAWLGPLYLLWIGVRFLIQQEPRKRLLSVVASVMSLICAAGLASMLEITGTMAMEGGLFEHQLSQGVGGIVGEFLAPVLLEPYIGPFGAFLVLLMGVLVGSIVVFTDNLGRLLDWMQNSYHSFTTNRAESKEARKKRKAEAAEARRLAKEEAARAKAAA
ncbi:MAG TPA: DNA translocase FtsK 4TM domain-containing protein, partial [Opitutales bacterium]|nr:DNA translocase FtsK 4TM domain-containing protein [Opitutales bacterium]